MKDHIYETFLDFGVIGGQRCEVFYDWNEPLRSSDSFEVSENGGATVIAVMVWIDGKEVDMFDYLNDNLIQDLEFECSEDYHG